MNAINADSDFLQIAKTTINTEIHALHTLINELDERFSQACQAILACRGRVVVMGMGKSGLIGRKIAATLASTGTPAFFVHPSEAGHGDLGMLVQGDVVIAISNSGQSDEIALLLPVIKKMGVVLISISRSHRGALPTHADIALTLGAIQEACPLGLAPTSSTTATLALGDALAVTLLHIRGFTTHDFAFSHPAGSLGKQLLTTVADIMHTKNLPIVAKHASLNDTLLVMTSGRLGLAVICDHNNHIAGIFTDGDLRRKLSERHDLSTSIDQLMSQNPKTINKNAKAASALGLMNNNNISQLLVIDDNDPKKLLGVISLHDLIQAGIS